MLLFVLLVRTFQTKYSQMKTSLKWWILQTNGLQKEQVLKNVISLQRKSLLLIWV